MKPVAMFRQQRVLLSALVTTLVLASCSGSAASKSSQDQYPERGDRAHTEADAKPLIHRVKLSHTGPHRFGLLPQARVVPESQELQVGCGDGSVKVRPKTAADVQVVGKKRQRRQAHGNREKRDYIRWYGSSTIQTFQPPQGFPTLLQPGQPIQTLQVQQPSLTSWQTYQPAQYIIPIWGNPRQIPVFFPAKPILFNPGYPIMNRFKPPSTSTPVNPTPTPTTNLPPVEETSDDMTKVTIGNRVGEVEEDRDAPVWGIVESEEVAASPLRTTTRRPITSAPRPSGRRPAPPLMHRPSLSGSGQGSSIITQTRSPPPNFNEAAQEAPFIREELPVIQSVRSTAAPERMPAQQLNRCVWAIISCCNPTNTQIKYNCFENLGCPGAFWDRSPCSREVTQAAVNAAQKFYEQS